MVSSLRHEEFLPKTEFVHIDSSTSPDLVTLLSQFEKLMA
jgi:hypothetical protein